MASTPLHCAYGNACCQICVLHTLHTGTIENNVTLETIAELDSFIRHNWTSQDEVAKTNISKLLDNHERPYFRRSICTKIQP